MCEVALMSSVAPAPVPHDVLIGQKFGFTNIKGCVFRPLAARHVGLKLPEGFEIQRKELFHGGNQVSNKLTAIPEGDP